MAIDNYMPTQLKNKTGHGGVINDKLLKYVFSYVWRSSLKGRADMRTELGNICNWAFQRCLGGGPGKMHNLAGTDRLSVPYYNDTGT